MTRYERLERAVILSSSYFIGRRWNNYSENGEMSGWSHKTPIMLIKSKLMVVRGTGIGRSIIIACTWANETSKSWWGRLKGVLFYLITVLYKTRSNNSIMHLIFLIYSLWGAPPDGLTINFGGNIFRYSATSWIKMNYRDHCSSS